MITYAVQQVLTLTEVEAAMKPSGWYHTARSSAARFAKPLNDMLVSNGLIKRCEERSIAAAVAVSSSTSVEAVQCLAVPLDDLAALPAVRIPAHYAGPPPGLPLPKLGNKVSNITQ
jgi:hypothetical protein